MEFRAKCKDCPTKFEASTVRALAANIRVHLEMTGHKVNGSH